MITAAAITYTTLQDDETPIAETSQSTTPTSILTTQPSPLLIHQSLVATSTILKKHWRQSLTTKLSNLSDSHGKFKRIIGVLLVVVGIVIIFGFNKDIQAFMLEKGWHDPISGLEMSIDN